MREHLSLLLGLSALAERAWKHWAVLRFFRRAQPPALAPEPVSILQPILSGDPTLGACLERNLLARSGFPREFIWLVDDDDGEAMRACRELIARYPQQNVRLIALPPPAPAENPKLVKLIAGLRLAAGGIVCVLDDDTMLPDDGLERCLPYLDLPGVGLVFGLPYYVNFSNLWSSLVAYFVDSHSLLTYIPYTQLSPPFTINGMFYAARRATLDAVGGFAGLEKTLADDFALAQRFRKHGYLLAQTPLCHPISTQVRGPRHYASLIQRWMIFPRESLLRHLAWRERALLYGVELLPALFPLALLLRLALRPSRAALGYALLYLGYSYAIFAHFNHAYLGGAAPWKRSWLVPIIQLVFPLQVLAALLTRQRINWRGHIIDVAPGGGLRVVRRRS